MTEDEMVGWDHGLNGHGFGWTPGVDDRQGGRRAAVHEIALTMDLGKKCIIMVAILYFISSVQFLGRVQLFVTPWTGAHQASLIITNSWSLLKLIYIE